MSSTDRRESVRWSLRDAEAEFPIHRDTLSKRLLQLGEKPDDKDTFSTKQICAAVFGDREAEKARLNKEQADRVALDNAERRRALIKVEDALTLARKFTFAAIAKFRGIDALSVAEKNVVIAELRGLADADFTALPDAES